MFPILATTERALAELAASASISASLDCNVYTGLDDETKAAPAVICGAYDAVEEFPDSGIWRIKAVVSVKEIAADTNLSSSLADTIYERFSTVDTGSLSATVSNYSVYNIQLDGCNQAVDNDTWVQTLGLEIVAVLT